MALKSPKGYLHAAIGGIVVKDIDIVNLLRGDGYICSEVCIDMSVS